MAEKEECIIPIDWDAVWGELAAKHISKYDRSTSIVRTTEDILVKHINNAINTITNNYTITTNTKLEVIKEIYLKEIQYNTLATLNAVKYVRIVTNVSLLEAKNIVTKWKEEISK